MPNTPDTIIFVVPKTFSDGSEAFDVILPKVELNAITEEDAVTLAEEITALINKHTNNTVGLTVE
jgi:hypothetical protein